MQMLPKFPVLIHNYVEGASTPTHSGYQDSLNQSRVISQGPALGGYFCKGYTADIAIFL
jgi:hypothetical protein